MSLPYTGDTKLNVILKDHPWLTETLPEIEPRFSVINSGLGKALVGRMTMEDLAGRAGYPVEVLLEKLEELIDAHDKAEAPEMPCLERHEPEA